MVGERNDVMTNGPVCRESLSCAQLAFERGQVVLDGLEQKQQPALRDHGLLILPVLIADRSSLKLRKRRLSWQKWSISSDNAR
jgi:hypothetical protein